MKFRVQFKDPDALHDALHQAAEASLPEGLEEDERDDVIEKRVEKLSELCDKWFRYDEYVVIEIDTTAKTATVVPVVQ